MAEKPAFRAPSVGERFFNRAFGFLVGLGIGFPYNYLLEVRGRKSGKIRSTPVDLLELNGKKFLVAPRGRTQWVRNAEAAGVATLKKGRAVLTFRLRALEQAEKLPVLKAYLDRFRREVQRYFPLPAGSPPDAFEKLADGYPVFELIARDVSAFVIPDPPPTAGNENTRRGSGSAQPPAPARLVPGGGVFPARPRHLADPRISC